MFTDACTTSSLAPFEGAEDTWTSSHSENPSAPSNGAIVGVLRSINILPLNGVKPILGDLSREKQNTRQGNRVSQSRSALKAHLLTFFARVIFLWSH